MSYALVKSGGGGESLYYLPERREPFIFPRAWQIPPGAIVLPRTVTIKGGQNVRFARLPEGAPIRVVIPTGTPARIAWTVPLTPRQEELLRKTPEAEREEARMLFTKEGRYTFPPPGATSRQGEQRAQAKVRTAQARALGLHPAEVHQRERKEQLEGYQEDPPVPIPPATHPSWRARIFGVHG